MRAAAAIAGSIVALSLLSAAAGAGGAALSTTTPRFTHVVVIVFENKSRDSVLGNAAAPTFASLSRRYATLTNYRGVAHPSLPNYLALVSGSTHGITSDCTDCLISAGNLADTLEAAGLSWKTYAEGLPEPGYTGSFAGNYAKKHDPFLYFRDVLSVPSRRRRVVPISVFASDLAAGKLPDYSLVVPDQCNDMHDCSVATGDRWLRGFLPPLLSSRQLRGGVVFVIFDESDNSDVGGGGIVPAYVAGPLVRSGVRTAAVLDHYRLLRTIEDGLGLPRLGRSATVRPIAGIWR